MYVSDYRYAADPVQANAWSAVAVNDWMYRNILEWTIIHYPGMTTSAHSITEYGYINIGDGYLTKALYVEYNK